MNKVRTRFAPSPTGNPESIHLGFVIRALWNYAYAKKNSGQFVLRIEDTDRKRSRKDTEKEILRVLKRFGIKWDEGPDIGGPYAPYRQSERLDKYQVAAHQLVRRGYAYYDFDAEIREKEDIKEAYHSKEKLAKLKTRPKARLADTKEAERRVEKGESYVVRVKIPEDRTFEYEDWILKKRVKFHGKEVPDLILLKSDGFPTYHLAVVVDDIDMEISHIFRGQEWISSTPIHLYIYEGLKHKIPNIGHFSVILDPRTGKKFSKRDMTALFGVNTWLSKGYLPEALLNYLMLLGWAPKDNREMFTLGEFVDTFDRDGIQKANPTFDVNKLDWFNNQYLQKLQHESSEKFVIYASAASGYSKNVNFMDAASETASLIAPRVSNIEQYDNYIKPFYEEPKVKVVIEMVGSRSKDHLQKAYEALSNLNTWSKEKIDEALLGVVKQNNFNTGDFFMDLRIALTGSKHTIPINDFIAYYAKVFDEKDLLKRIKDLL